MLIFYYHYLLLHNCYITNENFTKQQRHTPHGLLRWCRKLFVFRGKSIDFQEEKIQNLSFAIPQSLLKSKFGIQEVNNVILNMRGHNFLMEKPVMRIWLSTPLTTVKEEYKQIHSTIPQSKHGTTLPVRWLTPNRSKPLRSDWKLTGNTKRILFDQDRFVEVS